MKQNDSLQNIHRIIISKEIFHLYYSPVPSDYWWYSEIYVGYPIHTSKVNIIKLFKKFYNIDLSQAKSVI